METAKFIHVLAQMPLFANIKQEDISAILGCLGAHGTTYKKDEILIGAGEPVRAMGAVLEGRVRIIKEDADGNRMIIAEMGAGDVFAEALAGAQVESSPVSAETHSACIILWIDIAKITTVCAQSCGHHAQLIRNLVKILAEKNLLLNDKIEILALRTTREKLLAFLQRVSKGRHKFRIPLSRTELADYLGVDRSAMTRELSRMAEEGLVRFNKNEFELL